MVRIVRTLADGLDPARYRIHALFLQGPGPLVEVLQEASVPASSLNWWRGMRDPLGAWKFWNSLRDQEFSIVHLHFGGRSVSGLARSATNAKIVRHLHGRILEPRGLAPVNFSAHGMDAVVTVSQAVADRVVDGPAHVIYSGLPISGEPRATRAPDKEIVIGTAGRLVELKGIEYLIRALAAMHSEFPTLRLEIAGSGPQRSKLEAEVSRAGLIEKVRFLGWIDYISRVLSRWDAFVMPSLEEGFPIAALDAMAAGVPVIASAVGGVPELIEDGQTGWLVPPRDVDGLASRLRLLLGDPDARVKMGAAGFRRVRDHFNATQMTAKIAHLYDELLLETGKCWGK